MVPSELPSAPVREPLITDHDIHRMQDGTYPNAFAKASELAGAQHQGNSLFPKELLFLSLMTPDERQTYRDKLSQTVDASPSALTQIDYGQIATRMYVREDLLAYYIGEKQREGGILTPAESDFLGEASTHARSLFTEASRGVNIHTAETKQGMNMLEVADTIQHIPAPATEGVRSSPTDYKESLFQHAPEPSKDPDFILIGKTPPSAEGHYSEFRLQEVEDGSGPESGTKLLGHNEKDEQLVADYIKATEWMVALPGEYEHLRQYLENDGFLSDTELASALFDARLTREELEERIDRFESKATPEAREQITNYFWEVHGSVQDSPLKDLIDPTATYRLVAAEVDGQTPASVDKKKSLNEEQELERKQTKHHSLLELQFLSGGMVANFINNKRIIEELLTGKKQDQQNAMTTTQTASGKEQTADRWDYKQVANQLEPLGIKADQLQANGNLEALLNGRKTGLMRFEKEGEDGTKFPIEGKLYIAEVAGQGPTVHILQKLQTFTPPKFFLGYELTEADKQELLKTGNLNKVVDMRDRLTGETFKGNIGVDPDTNRLTPARLDRFSIPSAIHGVTLNEQQRESLRSGLPTRIEGMVNQRTGKGPFDGLVTMNAFERKFKIQEIPGPAQQETATQKDKVANTNAFKIPDEVYGLRLTPEQKKALENGDKVRLNGMTHPTTGEMVNARIQVRGYPPVLQLDDIKRAKATLTPESKANESIKPEEKEKVGTKNTSKTAVTVREGGGVVDISKDTATKKSLTAGSKTEMPKPKATSITEVKGDKPKAKSKTAKVKKTSTLKIR